MTSAQLDSIPTWPFLAGLAILWGLVVWTNRRRKNPRKWVDAPPPRNYWRDNGKKR